MRNLICKNYGRHQERGINLGSPSTELALTLNNLALSSLQLDFTASQLRAICSSLVNSSQQQQQQPAHRKQLRSAELFAPLALSSVTLVRYRSRNVAVMSSHGRPARDPLTKHLNCFLTPKALYVLTSSAPFFLPRRPFFTCVKT